MKSSRLILQNSLLLPVGIAVYFWAYAARSENNRAAFVAPQFASAGEPAAALAKELLAKSEVPGMSIAVEVDGKLVWSQALGLADREKQTPATRETIYRIGSISKLLTVAALAQLVQEGKMEWDAPVSRYLPDYDDAGGELTIRRLAGHTGGVRHYAGAAEFLSTKHCDSVTAALDIFRSDPLVFPPGSKYAYSSYGYVLLSAAMEKAAGEPFLTLVESEVLRPLEMGGTAADDGNLTAANRSAMYSLWQGKVTGAPAMDVSCRWAAGGYVSRAEDLARFLSAHLDGRLFRGNMAQVLFTSQMLADGKETGVGIGWRIAKDAAGRQFVHHGGDIVGGRAFVLMYPKERVALAICTSLGSAPFAEKEAQPIAALFVDAKVGPPQ